MTTIMLMVLSSWPKSSREFTRFVWWMQTERRVAANHDQANRKLAATIHIHHCHCYLLLSPWSWYSFYQPTEGGRMSRPMHCSKGAQPVPKAVYRSSCRDKHNHPWHDSNLCPHTLQSDALTTRPLWPGCAIEALIFVAFLLFTTNQ